MTANLSILLLRILSAGLLYAFLTGAVIIIWRDWRAVARQMERKGETATRSLGRLIVVRAGKTQLIQGEAIPLNVITRLGRAPANTVAIQDAFASSEHALLALRNGRWWLQDLNSRNGTLLNEEKLTASAIVSTGDVIGIGEVRLRIDLG